MDLSSDIIFRSLVCPTQEDHPTGRDSRIARARASVRAVGVEREMACSLRPLAALSASDI